jgi:hypothetical protein
MVKFSDIYSGGFKGLFFVLIFVALFSLSLKVFKVYLGFENAVLIGLVMIASILVHSNLEDCS